MNEQQTLLGIKIRDIRKVESKWNKLGKSVCIKLFKDNPSFWRILYYRQLNVTLLDIFMKFM